MQTSSTSFQKRLVLLSLGFCNLLLANKSLVFSGASKVGESWPRQDLIKQEWKNSKKKHKVSSSHENSLLFDFCLANYYKNNIPKEQEEELFKDIILKDKYLQCYDVIIKSYASQGNFQKILELPIFEDLEYTYKNLDKETCLILASVMDQQGKGKSSEILLANLERDFSEDESVTFFAVNKLISANKHDLALKKIDSFINSANLTPRHLPFFVLKAILLVQFANDPAKALLVLDKGLELVPDDNKLLQLKFNILCLLKEEEKSTEVLLRLSKQSDENSDFKKLLISKYINSQQYDKAVEQMESLNDNSLPFLLSKIYSLSKVSKKDKALIELENFIKTNGPMEQLASLRKQLLLDLKRHDDLLAEMVPEFLNKKVLDKEALVTILSFGRSAKKPEFIINSFLDRFSNIKNDVFTLLSLGDFALQQKFFAQAWVIFDFVSNLKDAPNKQRLYAQKTLNVVNQVCSVAI